MDRILIAWEIWQEDFGSGLSNVTGTVLEYVMGIANTEEEIKSYLDLKYGKYPIMRRLISIRKIKIHQLTLDEIKELRGSVTKVKEQ